MSIRIDNTILVLKHIVAIDVSLETTNEEGKTERKHVLTFNMSSGLTKKFYYDSSEDFKKILERVNINLETIYYACMRGRA